MKAKDYFEKYKDLLVLDAANKGVGHPKNLASLISDMLEELIDICEKRKTNTKEGIRSVVYEQNQKWNAIRTLFEKAGECPPIKRNGFIHLCKNYMFKEIFEEVELL